PTPCAPSRSSKPPPRRSSKPATWAANASAPSDESAMQWKMARPGKWADRINRWGLRHGFPLLLKIAPRMPRWLLLLGARLVISIVMGLHHRPKKAIARNLARVMGEPLGSRLVRAAVGQMLYNFACYWVDLFRFAQLPA